MVLPGIILWNYAGGAVLKKLNLFAEERISD
jgi:hypothetical protein